MPEVLGGGRDLRVNTKRNIEKRNEKLGGEKRKSTVWTRRRELNAVHRGEKQESDRETIRVKDSLSNLTEGLVQLKNQRKKGGKTEEEKPGPAVIRTALTPEREQNGGGESFNF